MIFEIFGTDAHSMTKSLMTAGDVTKRIPKDANIALKPNLVRAGSPETGATTHPGVLSGCIEYLQENGFSNISIIESSWIGGNTQQSFKTCGYDKVCQKYNVPFYDLKADKVKHVDTPLRPMEISQRALDADFLIDLPVLKGHSQTRITCALKNLKGCIPDHEKRQFHAEGLFKPIAALASALTPDLVIVDSICYKCFAAYVPAFIMALRYSSLTISGLKFLQLRLVSSIFKVSFISIPPRCVIKSV